MQIADFTLERYFARWEFHVRHLLCASDVEPMPLGELLALADDETQALWANLRLGYTESLGHPLLRREIASLYTSAQADDIVTFVGAEEAIFLTMHATLSAGDHAVVLWPAYQSLYEVARSIGASVTLVPLDPRTWSVDPEALVAAIKPNTRLVVVNFPHSPTGALASVEDFTRLASECEKRGITFFSDEVYRYLELDAAQRLPAGVDEGQRTVSLGVMSKSFALAGLRVGWIATHDDDLRLRVARLKDYTTICGSAPSEVLALIALRARDPVIQRSQAIIAGNLLLLKDFFRSYDERFEWVPPRGGSVAFPRLRSHEPNAIDRFCAELVETEGVLLLPGSYFEHGNNHFRIGYGRLNMPQALDGLERFLMRHND
ncbi:MAG TPA: aminotransferase class I/II-fold pyridoxal phosphate-dependent enzyme [Gemmatimonadaceae bacterium]|jgi:aspartate/methionine/tyrosine aminotransferase